MSKNLVIVESPAKAKTIEKYLGSDFTVLSSVGHIRSIVKKPATAHRQLTSKMTIKQLTKLILIKRKLFMG